MRSQEEIEERIKRVHNESKEFHRKFYDFRDTHNFIQQMTGYADYIKALLWVLEKDESYLDELED